MSEVMDMIEHKSANQDEKTVVIEEETIDEEKMEEKVEEVKGRYQNDAVQIYLRQIGTSSLLSRKMKLLWRKWWKRVN